MTALKITSPVDLVAAIPAVLGFAPEASTVVLGFTGTRLGTSARVDLPRTPDDAAEAAAALAKGLGAATPVVVVMVGAGGHRDTVAALRAVFVEVRAVLTVADFRPGRTVRDKDGTVLGALPDHRMTEVGLAHTVAGRTVAPHRAGLAAELDPTETNDEDQATADALADPVTRDAALLRLVADPAGRARWAQVARRSQGPGRGRVAALLAAAHYAAGDGPRARIAIDVADTDDPGNRLAHLLGAALDSGIHPTDLRTMFTASAQRG